MNKDGPSSQAPKHPHGFYLPALNKTITLINSCFSRPSPRYDRHRDQKKAVSERFMLINLTRAKLSSAVCEKSDAILLDILARFTNIASKRSK